MIGQQLGHYRVVEKIGAGGMGEVYRARDEHLERDVAIKVLPVGTLADEAARKRFRKEALALSKLNHPNIATIFDFDTQDGVDFLVMELVVGESLSEKLPGRPLPEKDVLRIGAQLAEGLAAAHEQNVIHRDLKPGNLRLTPDGRLKILDFGLAKLIQPFSLSAPTASVTETRAVAGTLPYMAPEQLRGEKADARSDIYAAGVVLYELAAGRRPFEQKLSSALAAAIVHETPPPPQQFSPQLSPRLQEALLKCLEKDPENRYQSAKELLVDLRRLAAATTVVTAADKVRVRRSKAIDRLAVLPLLNASADSDTDYFSDGITESIIGSLSQLPGLRVMARSTVFRYKGRDVDSQTVGRELNVRAVVTGRVLKRGDSVILGLELVDVEDGAQLWSCYYNRRLDQIFSLQETIATEISDNLRLRLSRAQRKRLTKRYTQNVEAYQLYLKGRFHWNQRTSESLKKSIEFFEQAIEKDPNYALAHSGLADAYNISPYHGSVSSEDVFPKGKAAATKAVALDETLAEAHTSLAHILAVYDWAWAEAEREFRRALELNANYATARHWYGVHYLAPMGRIDEAMGEMECAVELDPVSPIINTNLGRAYHFARQLDRAIEQYQKALELDPDFGLAHRFLMDAYAGKGMIKEAIEEFTRGGYTEGGSAEGTAELREAWANRGVQGYWGKRLELAEEAAKHSYVPPSRRAMLHARLGEEGRAFEWLDRAIAERDAWVFWLKVSPDYETLRADLRFPDLLCRIGLQP